MSHPMQECVEIGKALTCAMNDIGDLRAKLAASQALVAELAETLAYALGSECTAAPYGDKSCPGWHMMARAALAKAGGTP